MARDFDVNEFPLAYLISFRTYGTWLHGDNRGSTSRKQNKYGTPRITANRRLEPAERQQLKYPPIKLDSRQRPMVNRPFGRCVPIADIGYDDQCPDQSCAHGSLGGH